MFIRGTSTQLLLLMLFLIGGLLALTSLRYLTKIKEEGEVEREKVVNHMHVSFRKTLRSNLGREVTNGIYYPRATVKRKVVKLVRHRKQQSEVLKNIA